MGSYIGRRVLMLIPVLLTVAVVSFLIMYLVPGDPASMMLGSEATTEEIEQLREDLGLNEPVLVQFFKWFSGVLRGNLGMSIFMNEPVIKLILERLPVTFSLAIAAELIAILVAIPLGILAAVKHNTFWDQLVMTIAVLGVSLPGFWLGIIFILFFAVYLGWFPVQGYVMASRDLLLWARHLFLPAVALGLNHAGVIARITRSSMLEILYSDFIRTARSKGLEERKVVYKHGLKNALIPVVTVAGLSFTALLGGAIIMETVFALPGLGRLMINAINRRDYPLVQGILIFKAFLCVVINLVVDVSYAYLDPRIKYN
jgi:peptide/nickel transport system permease protein